MVRAVTLIPGTTEFGYEPETVVQIARARPVGAGKPPCRLRRVRHRGLARRSAGSLPEPRARRGRRGLVRQRSARRRMRRQPGVEIADQRDLCDATGRSPASTAPTRIVVSTCRRPARLWRHAVRPKRDGPDRGAEGARAQGHALSVRDDGYSGRQCACRSVDRRGVDSRPIRGAAASPAIRRRASPARPTVRARRGTQVDAFFGSGDPDAWDYRRMVLHYAQLAADAGGVDAFLIGSELRSLTRVRSASGVYPAVTRLAELAADVKAIVGGGTIVTYGADWTEYGAHVVDPAAQRSAVSARSAVGFVRDRCGRHRLLRAARRLARRRRSSRPRAGLDRSTIPAICAGNLRGGEVYDWYYADDADARRADPHADHRRPRQAVGVSRQGHLELVVATRITSASAALNLASPTAWSPQSQADLAHRDRLPRGRQGRQPAERVSRSEIRRKSGLPYFSDGARDDLHAAPLPEAVLGAFDPAFGASDAINPTSSVYGGRMIRAVRYQSVDLGRAALSGLSRSRSMSGATAPTGTPVIG